LPRIVCFTPIDDGASDSRSAPGRRAAKHEQAVATTLRLAEESAAAGDYSEALAWLGTLLAIGERLPASYDAKRAAWTAAIRQTSLPLGRATERQPSAKPAPTTLVAPRDRQ